MTDLICDSGWVKSKSALMKWRIVDGVLDAGYTNSGDEELSHWKEMQEGNGDEMCRWHILLEP